MASNKNNQQAQMLMLLNQVTNLENQLKMGNMPQTNGMNSSNALNIMSQLKLLQGKVPISNNVPRGNQAPNLTDLLAAVSGNSIMNRSRCAWVTGLPEEYQDADKLLNIFGNFGNIQRIKFTDKKPDGALIEFDDPRSVFKCRQCFKGVKLEGQELSITWAKFEFAPIKKEDTKSKDVRKVKENWRFSSSPQSREGRFRKIIMSRLKMLTPMVLVSNLPEGKSDLLKKYIIEAGYTVKSVEGSQRPEDKEKPSTGYTMVKVELASVEEAIGAVANLHNVWPKKFGNKKKDVRGNERGLMFSFAGKIQEKSKKSKE